MKPTIEILEKINQNSKKNKNEIFTRLYRYLLREDIYYVAYKKLYANNGAATKGVNNDTADGFSKEKVNKIIEHLASENYIPKPSRRTYIKKSNGKKRPLGLPTFTDKLIQEVLRMILEAIYEPIFLDCSHGFRPKRSCHTALKRVKFHFNGARWFIEGDIKGCFNNINHSILIRIINKKIKDARIIKLLYKFLKAGYLEDWKYNKTYSGTPQGGIVSPILSNIYLHELDKYVENQSIIFDKPKTERCTPEYNKFSRKVEGIRRKIKRANSLRKPILLKELKSTRAKMLKTPFKSQTDKKLKYIRYADDFIIGVNGSKLDCIKIKSEVKDFIKRTLKMELSEEKTLITHSEKPARFLSYDVRVRRNLVIKPSGKGYTSRTLSNKTELNIPLKEKIEKFLFEKKAVEFKNGKLNPIKRNILVNLTELEIVSIYNAELRGLCNYYNPASNFNMLNYFSYLMEYSCLKTLAAKRKSSISKIIRMYKDGKGKWCIPYNTKKGKRYMYIAKHKDSKNTKVAQDLKDNQLIKHMKSTTSFEDRLNAKVCEICGTKESKCYEIHHVNKVKNLSGKLFWEKIMIAKRRKTIVVCKECHYKIHSN